MNTFAKNIVITLAAAVGSSAVLAEDLAWPPVHPAGESLSRQEVRQAMVEFQNHPVVNGWRYLGGEAGWELLPIDVAEDKERVDVLDELTAYLDDPQQRQRHLRFYHSGS